MNHSSFLSFVKETTLAHVLVLFCFCATTFGQIEKKPCPELEIQMPSRALADRENFTFSLTAKDGTSLENVTVKWTVSIGRFINDDNSRTVTFTSSRDMAGQTGTITATVKDFPKGCLVIVSDEFGIVDRLPNETLDEWGKASDDLVLGRIAFRYNVLTTRVPHNEGVLVMSFPAQSTSAYKISKIKQVLRAIKFRGNDPRRLSFYFNANRKEDNTTVWTIPPGFDYSDIGIDEAQLIKAEEISARLKTLFK